MDQKIVNKKNTKIFLVPSFKTTILSLLLVCIVTILGFTIPSASAISCAEGATPATIDCSISIGETGNVVSLRDVTDTSNVTNTATVALDKSRYDPGNSGTVTITDSYANLDSSIQDIVLVKLTSLGDPVGISLVATETDLNTSNFVGVFSVTTGPSSGTALHIVSNDNVMVTYSPVPPFASRFQLTFDNAGGAGDAIQSDLNLFPDDEINNGFNSVVTTANFTLANGASLDYGATQHIVLSYANAELDCVVPPGSGCDTDHLTLWISPPSASPYHTFVEWAAYPGNPGGVPLETIDTVAKTISFDTDLTSIDGSTSGTWLFVLTFDTNGGVGGGGGGIVRPGLVLNILAGLSSFGGGGADNSPPTFHLTKSSATQADPFQTMSPSNDNLVHPLAIDGKKFDLPGYANTIPPDTVKTGDLVDLTLTFLDASKIAHVAIHLVDTSNADMSDMDPMITFDNGNVITSDPEGLLGDDVSFHTSKDGFKTSFEFGFSFNKPTNRNLMITAWDDKRNVANTKVFNAFEVAGAPVPLIENHFFFNNLGQYDITQEGVTDIKSQDIIQENPVVGFDYSNSIGRIDRHDMAKLYGTIDNEKTRADNVVDDNFHLGKNMFAAEDKKSSDTKRAPELTWSNVGHKLRDNAKSPSENEEFLKGYCWQEHLRAEKTLKSLLVGSKYHQD